jgi:CRP/FNR family transcriptional regulator, cyclic AMP receptor protein
MTSITDRHREALLSNPWFAGLAPAIRDDALAHTQTRTLAQGERLFSRGDDAHACYAVLEGSIRISGTSRGGREAVLSFYEPGTWFGEISLLDGLPRTHDAHAHKRTLLLVLMRDRFEELLAAHPLLMRELLRLECTRLRAVLVGLESYATQSLEQRFAGRLLALAEAYGSRTARGLSIELHLSQEVLAQLTGVTRQRVNQLLKVWENEGLIEQSYGRVLLIDQARLERIAQD